MIENPFEQNIKSCVILFNLGGPKNQDDVERFLFDLFFDKRIIPVSIIPRFFIAKLISKLRKNKAKHIYSLIGGGSPIVQNTTNQAIKLQKYLQNTSSIIGEKSINWRVFFAMRHSEPFLSDIIKQIKEFDPQEIILLPLYPQYSTTTTESFFDVWSDVFEKKNLLNSNVSRIIDYHENPIYIRSCIGVIEKFFKEKNLNIQDFHLIFSAHGLPESIVKNGDPYQKQTEKTYELIISELLKKYQKITSNLCYQSRVGPKKWIGPSTSEFVESLSKNGCKNIAIFPISFTSEHSETLVELDIEIRDEIHAIDNSINYIRIPTIQESENFIECLGVQTLEILKKSLK
jgi:ferrochelatase